MSECITSRTEIHHRVMRRWRTSTSTSIAFASTTTTNGTSMSSAFRYFFPVYLILILAFQNTVKVERQFVEMLRAQAFQPISADWCAGATKNVRALFHMSNACKIILLRMKAAKKVKVQKIKVEQPSVCAYLRTQFLLILNRTATW